MRRYDERGAVDLRERIERLRSRVERVPMLLRPVIALTVILVDDGLASGYTMITAARMVRRREPSQIVVAIPTASLSTAKLLAQEVDMIVCPNIRTGYSFAVADAYRNWYDLSREEVIGLLRERGLLAS